MTTWKPQPGSPYPNTNCQTDMQDLWLWLKPSSNIRFGTTVMIKEFSSWQARVLPSFPKANLVLTNVCITLQHGRKTTKQNTVNEDEENDEHERALKAA